MFTCKVDGCDKPRRALGYCFPHYHRSRKYGDPLAGGTYFGEPARFLNEVAVPFAGDDCLIWPFGSGGYAHIRHDGRMIAVHRLVCILAHGPAPSEKHEAAHECGKGHLGCCNPQHLSWKTSAENKADMVRHGSYRNGRTKLRPQDVNAIRTAPDTSTALALQYGVSRSAIKHVRRFRTWRAA